MKLPLSAFIITAIATSVSAQEFNSDQYGRTINPDEPLLVVKEKTRESKKTTKSNLLFQPQNESLSTLETNSFSIADETNFTLGTSYKPGQTSIGSVEFGDVDGDGDLELIATSNFYFDEINDYSVFIFHPTTEGLGVPTQIKYNATANRNGLTLADLDGNGSKEIIVGHGQGLSIIKSDGAGGFETQLVDSSSADTLDALDIDQDGNLDLIGLPWSSPANQYIGDGNGNISTIVSLNTNASGYNDQAIGDLNNDGFDDLVVMSGQSYATPNISIHLHDGVDSLMAPETYFVSVNENTGGLGVGDVNGDGLDDVVLSRSRNSPTHLWVYTQNADGNLDGPVELPSYDIPETIRIADLNGDGFEDIIVLHGGWTKMGIYLNSDSGYGDEIKVSIPYASHYDPEGLALGDLDNDGCPEMIAIADYNHGVVPVTHNLCPIDNSVTENYSEIMLWSKIITFTTSEAGSIDITLDFEAEGDLDLYLFDADKKLITQSSTSGNPEVINSDELPAGTYYAKVLNRQRRWMLFDMQIVHH